ncbi:MAG: glycosyltransferase [Chloroflexi bacterium]|nr:glycosyltransferase [Chloroflexota bacterium]
MKLALVHDYLNQYGGAERVLEELHALWPGAPIYTSIYDPAAMPPAYRQLDIRPSFMQRLPGVMRHHQPYLLLYPFAFEALDLSGYDVVLSNSSAFCKGVVTPPSTLHLCYCLTPMRWVWSYHEYVRRERLGGLARAVLPVAIDYLRLWDVASANRVDHFAAISHAVAARIRKHYRREAAVIYPPVNTAAFHLAPEPGDFFLVVSRLIPYKRIDLAVEACTRLGLPLKVVGAGRDRSALERRAGPTVQFLGKVSEAELADLYARCKALIFPGEEDFGIVPLEAQAAGRPVVAFASGGALETVVDGRTGLHFHQPTPEALAQAIRRLDDLVFDPRAIRAHAERFDVQVFRGALAGFVERAYQAHLDARARLLPAPSA